MRDLWRRFLEVSALVNERAEAWQAAEIEMNDQYSLVITGLPMVERRYHWRRIDELNTTCIRLQRETVAAEAAQERLMREMDNWEAENGVWIEEVLNDPNYI